MHFKTYVTRSPNACSSFPLSLPLLENYHILTRDQVVQRAWVVSCEETSAASNQCRICGGPNALRVTLTHLCHVQSWWLGSGRPWVKRWASENKKLNVKPEKRNRHPLFAALKLCFYIYVCVCVQKLIYKKHPIETAGGIFTSNIDWSDWVWKHQRLSPKL